MHRLDDIVEGVQTAAGHRDVVNSCFKPFKAAKLFSFPFRFMDLDWIRAVGGGLRQVPVIEICACYLYLIYDLSLVCDFPEVAKPNQA